MCSTNLGGVCCAVIHFFRGIPEWRCTCIFLPPLQADLTFVCCSIELFAQHRECGNYFVYMQYVCACAEFHTHTLAHSHRYTENRQHIIYDAQNFSRIRFRAHFAAPLATFAAAVECCNARARAHIFAMQWRNVHVQNDRIAGEPSALCALVGCARVCPGSGSRGDALKNVEECY